MTPSDPVGLLGAYGGVGTAAAAQLHAWGIGPLRVGGRSRERAAMLVEATLAGAGEPVAVDVEDPSSLRAFCSGCGLVVNCAGPSFRIRDRVAVAAAQAGADYVDSGGDELAGELLDRPGRRAPGRAILLSAGMLPGVSALLPRALAAQASQPPDRLTVYAGGRGRFSPAAAADYLATVTAGSGTPLAEWRDGAVRSGALSPLRSVELPFFPARVTAHPYLSRELERLAIALGLRVARWYTVFDGERVPEAIERRPPADDAGRLERAARELVRAAELDLFGRDPYQLFVVSLDRRTLVLRARDPLALTGAMTALAARAVRGGELAPGLGYAGEAMEPIRALERLRAAAAVTSIEVLDLALHEVAELVQEGVL